MMDGRSVRAPPGQMICLSSNWYANAATRPPPPPRGLPRHGYDNGEGGGQGGWWAVRQIPRRHITVVRGLAASCGVVLGNPSCLAASCQRCWDFAEKKLQVSYESLTGFRERLESRSPEFTWTLHSFPS